MGQIIDLTGQKFGMLTVIERVEDHVQPSGKTVPQWRCRCECGRERIVQGNALRHGDTISCGCYKRSMSTYKGKEIMAIPVPGPITIKDTLIIGETYTVKKEQGKLLGLYDTFARFQFEDGHIESFLYWDLERWKYHPEEEDEEDLDV